MALINWLEDTSEEFGNALRLRIGERLEKKDRRPTRDVKQAVGAFLAGHPTPDTDVYTVMAEALIFRESTHKRIRAQFRKDLAQAHLKPERIFRWFLVQGPSLDLEIADDAAIRAAYAAYWHDEFDKLLKSYTSIAFERDSNDTAYYDTEAHILGDKEDW